MYVALGAAQHEALPALSAIMLPFVLLLTAVTVLIVTVRAVGATRPGRLAGPDALLMEALEGLPRGFSSANLIP